MAWNHRSRVVAVAVALQSALGAFVQPSAATDLIAAASPTNSVNPITATDATATGSVWESNRILLSKQATVGFTIPLRGPGGVAPPAANAWAPGRVMQAAGWSEFIKNTPSSAALTQGGVGSTFALAATESSVDGFLVGAPFQQASIGAGFKATSMVAAYGGAARTVRVAEAVPTARNTGDVYNIPAFVSYVLGTLTTPPPVLSISVWRDKKRYDFRDWAPTSLAINIPVANDQNTSFPDITTSGSCVVQAIADDTTPSLPTSLLQISVPPARNGKFFLDGIKLGHQSLSFTEATTVGAASNQNQAAGQDGYDILSGTRTTAIDLNQMNVSDFDINIRENQQTVMPVMSTWGMGPGNNFGFIEPNIVIDPFSPGDRNGYVSLTGNAYTTDIDKSAALAIWW